MVRASFEWDDIPNQPNYFSHILGIIFIYIADGAPSREALGATNGLAQTVASTMRAMSPVSTASLFAVSTEKNVSGGYMVYWILMAIVAMGIGASFLLPSRLLADETEE